METKKGLSDSDKQLLYILFSILLVAAAFFFGFSPMKNKASEIKTKNESLQLQVKNLQTMQLHTSDQKKLIKMFEQSSDLMKVSLPSGITEEKIIYIMNDLQKETGIKWSSLNMQLNKPIAAAAADGTQAAAPAEANAKIEEGTGLVSTVDLPFDSLTYENLKKVVEFFANQPDRITVSDMNVSYDNEKNKLSGTMKINFYCMHMNKKNEYKAPVIPDTDVPVDGNKKNIFDAYGAH